jgi:Ni,Fe-hydrogenase maturation factor
MIEAVYLTEVKPDIHLFTISVEGVTPMTVSLSPEVEAAIPEAIEQILALVTGLKGTLSSTS